MRWQMTHSSWQRSTCFFFSAFTRWHATWSCFGSDRLFEKRGSLTCGEITNGLAAFRFYKQKQYVITVVQKHIDNFQEFAMVKKAVILSVIFNIPGGLLRHSVRDVFGVVVTLWMLLSATSAA